jgi:PAS domain S-box-containing protein
MITIKNEKPTIQAANRSQLSDLSFRSIIDCLPCCLSIQDSTLHILFVNQTFKNEFGDGIGKSCHMVYKKSPTKCASCPVQKTFADKKVHIGEQTMQLTNGNICRMIVNSAPIFDKNGEVTAVIEMATNITQIKKMQKELTTLGQSIALLSHGIKNILEGLQGGAYVVDEGFKDGDIELAGKGWTIVNKNIFDISDVVQNILYSSKNRPLKYETISPNQLALDSVQLFKEKAAALNIKLELQSQADLPDVRLDAAGIRRMLHNLIWNALEACHNDKGKQQHVVTVKTASYDHSHCMFEIADNGIGMDQATRRNIFEEFFSTKGSGGTGLGLAVVEKVVNRHGGRIEVDSAPGAGCTFRIIFNL